MTTEELYRRFPDGVPDALLDLDDVAVLRALGQPTLLRVPGTDGAPPRAITCLLHGDEPTGYQAIMRVLRRRRRYPFDLYVFIGNVPAALADAGFAHRFLDDQEDFNRIWDTADPSTNARLVADAVTAELREAEVAAVVDFHNNSGNNPYYAIVPRVREDHINLATIFTTTLLHWELDVSTLMEAMADQCGAIAVECGMASRPESVAFAVDGLRRFLAAPQPRADAIERDYDLLGNMRRVVVVPEIAFAFDAELRPDVDFVVVPDADRHNFARVPAGHVIGRVRPGVSMPLQVRDAARNDVTAEHFDLIEGAVVTHTEVMPLMMTRTVEAARKDCLFYVVDELEPPAL